jgi:hypothetical protein
MPSLPLSAYPQYLVTFIPGKLYVNAYGPGARKIVVKRECVRKLLPAVNGYEYESVFSYENPNNTALYIPKGGSNFISIVHSGSFENTLPEIFLPGYHEITIRFNGLQMYWSVTSNGSTHRTAGTAANNAVVSCNAVAAKGLLVENRTRDEGISLYPNPASGTIYLAMTTNNVQEKNIVITDALGKTQPVRSVHKYTSQVQIDISHLGPGTYFIRVQLGDGYKTLKFIKQ